jgi:hypothetical protein
MDSSHTAAPIRARRPDAPMWRPSLNPKFFPEMKVAPACRRISREPALNLSKGRPALAGDWKIAFFYS